MILIKAKLFSKDKKIVKWFENHHYEYITTYLGTNHEWYKCFSLKAVYLKTSIYSQFFNFSNTRNRNNYVKTNGKSKS